jgi:hypothetical protein
MTQAVVQAVFLAVPVDVVGYAWMNYSLCICPAVCAFILLNMKMTYSRYVMDHARQPLTKRVLSTSSSTATTFSLTGTD